MAPLTFTYDLEDSRASSAVPERYSTMTSRVLDFLDEHGARGTFFVVGELAEASPALVAEIAARGHEVALHGWRHVPLDQLSPAALREDLRRGKALLEDATGAEVTGFRAPIFSLVPATVWATDELRDAGFAYSSSVLPARNPLYGFAGAPRAPFRWPSGLVELPCPVAGAGRVSLPYLGGVYLRYLPLPVILALADHARDAPAPWIYCHPYDFDAEEPFTVMPHAGWLTSRILHLRRGRSFERIATLLTRQGAGAPLGELVRTGLALGPPSVGSGAPSS
jgi:polysaccharide deacetylase family protein (PEP-CTERM system associated)